MKQIAISIERIKEEIYALSALRTYVNHTVKILPLLHKDRETALNPVIFTSLGEVIMQLHGFVSAMNYDGDRYDNSTIVTLDVTLSADATATAVCRAIESAVIHTTLAMIYEDGCLAEAQMHSQRAATSIDNVKYLGTMTSDNPTVSIVAHR